MERCRWVYDKSLPEGGFEVPGCWSRAISEDNECHCLTDDELAHQNTMLDRDNSRLRKEVRCLEARIGRLYTVPTPPKA